MKTGIIKVQQPHFPPFNGWTVAKQRQVYQPGCSPDTFCHTHTLDSVFSPSLCCSFWAVLSVFLLTDFKSRSQKKEQKLHWIADDSVEFPNSLPGQTCTPEKFGRVLVKSASQAQPLTTFSSRLNPASGNLTIFLLQIWKFCLKKEKEGQKTRC